MRLAERGAGAVDLVVAHQPVMAVSHANAAIPSWRPGVMTPSVIGVPVGVKLRYWKPSGRCRRTTPSVRSATGPIGP